MATSYSAAIVKAMQDHILSGFDDYDPDMTSEEAFVSEMDNLIKNMPGVDSPQQAIRMLYQGGTWLVYYDDIQPFLKSIGVDDGKKHEGYESAELYERMLVRDGTKLYNKLKSAPKSKSPKSGRCGTAKSESIKDMMKRGNSGKGGKKKKDQTKPPKNQSCKGNKERN